MEINYREVRAAARKLSAASSAVRSVAANGLRQIERDSQEYLQGRTAEALQSKTAELRRDIASIANGLSQLSAELNEYARRIQLADQEASNYINNG